jgi:predicted RNA methylase
MERKTGLNRDTTDKFYTKKSVAEKYIKITKNLVKNIDLIIEPSAGNGSFLQGLNKHFANIKILAYDIKPDHKDIKKQDYLDIDNKMVKEWKTKNVLVIGNPPFGRQSSMAKKFIKFNCKFSKYIAFILSKSFKKPSMFNVFSNYYHKIFEEDIDDNSFLLENKDYNVPCVFQIWELKEYEREKEIKYVPKGFEFTKDKDDATFSFRRVGVNSGIVDLNIDKSEQSHYFIKLKKNNKDVIKELSNYKWDFNDTIGAKSISKNQLTKILNEIIKANKIIYKIELIE